MLKVKKSSELLYFKVGFCCSEEGTPRGEGFVRWCGVVGGDVLVRCCRMVLYVVS